MLSRNGGIFLVMISLYDTVLIRSKHSKLTDSFVNLETKLHAFDGEPDTPWSGVSGINVPLPLNEIEKKKPDLETLMDHGVIQECCENGVLEDFY
uniref:Uncharacterized protein n=1 Tax=Acrobeloides nanus TaxID=290746 RepID=A0A914D7X2_9BILA